MSSTFLADPRARATWRWGGAIAALLVVHSLLLATLFWLLASGSHDREADRAFAQDCRDLAGLEAPGRRTELREMLARDIHRDRFLALFAPDGRLIEGNVARLPADENRKGSFVAPVQPTELPGKDADVARLTICAMPDGARLLTGLDLDDAEEALRVVERSLMFGLVPGLLLAIGFGLVAGRRAARQVDAVRALTERFVTGDFDRRLTEDRDPTTSNLLQEVQHAIDKYQWQMRAMIQSTPTDPNTGADLNSGRPIAPAGRPSASVN